MSTGLAAAQRAGRRLLRQIGLIPPLDLANDDERLGLRLFWIDGLLLAAGGAFLGSYLSLFVIAAGATGGQIGVMTSLSNLAALLGYLAAGRFLSLVGGPKRAALFSSRLVEAVSAPAFLLLPFFVRPPMVVYAAMGLMVVRAFLAAIGSGAWTIFAGLVTPVRLRGRYFSSRSVIKALMAVLLVPAAGELIAWRGGYPHGFQLSFALALPLLLGAAYMFSRIPEPATATPKPEARQRDRAGVWRSGRFLRFIAASAVWNLGATVVTPFYAVFMARQLGLGADAIGVLTTVSTAATIAGYACWGPLADRRGAQWVLSRTALVSASMPWLWLPASSPWHIVPVQALSGFLAGGFGVAHTNRLLEAMPEGESATAMSTHLMLQGLAGIAGSLAGGYLFDRLGLPGPALVAGSCAWLGAALFALLSPRQARHPGSAGVSPAS